MVSFCWSASASRHLLLLLRACRRTAAAQLLHYDCFCCKPNNSTEQGQVARPHTERPHSTARSNKTPLPAQTSKRLFNLPNFDRGNRRLDPYYYRRGQNVYNSKERGWGCSPVHRTDFIYSKNMTGVAPTKPRGFLSSRDGTAVSSCNRSSAVLLSLPCPVAVCLSFKTRRTAAVPECALRPEEAIHSSGAHADTCRLPFQFRFTVSDRPPTPSLGLAHKPNSDRTIRYVLFWFLGRDMEEDGNEGDENVRIYYSANITGGHCHGG